MDVLVGNSWRWVGVFLECGALDCYIVGVEVIDREGAHDPDESRCIS